MTKKTKTSVVNGGQKRVPPTSGQFTPMTAKQAQEASVRSRNLRKQVRAQMLEKLVNNLDFADELEKAIKSGDLDRMNLLQTALKIIGLHHDQSEDAVKSGISVKASTSGETGDKPSEQSQLKVEFEVIDGRSQN